jgi:putative spermidine/putrescine transport system ATP-binding protein
MALADTMVVMNHGRIEQSGTPQEVFNKPASEFVARFTGRA